LQQDTTRTSREETLASLVDLLALVQAGKATVTVGGRPFLSIDSDDKTLEVDAYGAREAGFRLSALVSAEEGRVGVLEGSRHVAGALARLGWRLTLSAEGEQILNMGRGASRLTGRISVNPLKLRKLLDALK
jgi:hypothetical protein